MALTTGQVLQGRYQILSRLGQGGMGAVYRAWDTRLKISVAIKEMTPQPGLDPQVLEGLRQQFRQEAQTLARLSHPHLVRVGDFFEEEGNTYLTMDFVEGESLAELIRRQGALPEAHVLAWADQLLDALAYCHSRGVIHRDIKPQNVIIRSDGQAVLVDFGLVKLWNPADPQTRTAMRGMGTPEYAPPEQYDVAGHTDPRTDIYSLGATLYHALTGQAPPTATMRIANPAQYRPVRELNPYVSPRTEAVILKATELSLEKRFASAWEMAAALRGEIPVSLTPPVAAPPSVATVPVGYGAGATMPAGIAGQVVAPKAARRREVPVWAWGLVGAAAILLIVAVGILIALMSVGRNRAAGPTAATETAVAFATQNAAATASATPLIPTPTEPLIAAAPTAAPTNTPSVTPTFTPTPQPTPTPSPTSPPSPSPTAPPTTPPPRGVLFDFEQWRAWRRGDQPHGSLTQTNEQAHTGSYAAKLAYEFPESDQDFVVFLQPVELRGQPDTFSAWVYGDGSGHYLNFWIQDAEGQVWSVHLGKVGGASWKQMVGRLDPALPWPSGHISGPNDGAVDYPVRFYALVLDRPGAGPLRGQVYIDDIAAWQRGEGGPTPEPEITETPRPTDTPIPSAGPLYFPEPTRLDAWRAADSGYECTIIVHISGGAPPFRIYHDAYLVTPGTNERDYPLVFQAHGCSIVHTITVESADGQRYSDDYYIPSPWCG